MESCLAILWFWIQWGVAGNASSLQSAPKSEVGIYNKNIVKLSAKHPNKWAIGKGAQSINS